MSDNEEKPISYEELMRMYLEVIRHRNELEQENNALRVRLTNFRLFAERHKYEEDKRDILDDPKQPDAKNW